jgi:hypothetical protein
MRINELLESVDINLDHRNEQDKDKKDLDFDLVEDLVYFLNNDDDTYRRDTHSAIEKCLGRIKENKPTHPSIFKVAALRGYKNYINKYDLPKLPDSLDEDVCEEVCKKMHEDTCKHAEEGKYED